jgi:hypothetical protein
MTYKIINIDDNHEYIMEYTDLNEVIKTIKEYEIEDYNNNENINYTIEDENNNIVYDNLTENDQLLARIIQNKTI